MPHGAMIPAGRKTANTHSLSDCRARIVLLSTEGLSGREIGRRTGVAAQTVGKWRSRFERDGIRSPSDAPRGGRPRTIGDETDKALCK